MLVLSSWLAAACGGDGEVQIFTDDEIGLVIEVEPNEEFEIRLESNPSTGYAWEVSAMTSPDLVMLKSEDYEERETELVGAAGTEVFVFAAGNEGAGILRLEYIRSFDDPIVPERVAEFIIRIDDAQWLPSQGTGPHPNTVVVPGEE